MVHYCVNKNAQTNGDHEVHKVGCRWYPQQENRLSLGDHPSCKPAVVEAKKTYPKSNGCAHCSPACNTG
ncbi:MAG: hypothetical protein HOJ34_05065 [Kordiimonadaceae bacterium]|jgi:hypothetical protein|nr:hypothetical protein [Kordiimonadaceae bacterium]MBT6037366.1 hypothetical protein [Kordiimonadaceae bacterium]MBT6329133.1 hypothetical protein [Kordiimonadaceae bacterium]